MRGRDPWWTLGARGRLVVVASLVIAVPVALLALQLHTFQRGTELTQALSQAETRSEVQQIGLRIRHHLMERANDLEVLAEVWRVHQHDPDYARFRSIASSFLADELCYHAINYVDADSVVRATVPDSNRAALLDLDLKKLPQRREMHTKVRESNRPMASPPITLVGKHPGFVLWHPIRADEPGKFHGLVAAAIKTDVLLGAVLHEKPDSVFLYQVRLDGQVIHGEPDESMLGAEQATFEALGRSWTVLARPKPGTALARVEEPIQWHLMLGIALSLLSGLLLLSVARTNHRLAQAQQRLRSNEEQIRITLDSIGEAVIATDTTGRVETMNPIAEKITGWTLPEAKGQLLPDVYRVVDAVTREPRPDPVQRVLADGDSVGDGVLLARDGVERSVADSGAAIRDDQQRTRGVVLVFRDVTEEIAIEEKLRQSQKLQAVGQLAGGVAHDFNNMLTGIMGAGELLSYIVTDAEARSYCKMILESAERASQLTQKLLAFARKRPPALVSMDVHEPVRAALDLVRTAIDPRVQVEVDLRAERSLVNGDVSQLQNAFLNLFLNAAQAMPEGGTLRVSSRVVELDEDDCEARPLGQLEPGPHIELEVRDTGQGISPENLGRIFEPFFTTKAPGKGTGLGLAMVYGTVQTHKGAITLQSELGRGTMFVLHLPLSGTAAIPVQPSVAPRGTGRILVVDDEEPVRATTKALLERLGYEVTTAADGREGLTVFKAAPASFDLVIVDMAMPEMSGQDCFFALREIRPAAKVILASGLIQPEELDRMLAAGLAGCISKPFRSAELGQLVRDTLI